MSEKITKENAIEWMKENDPETLERFEKAAANIKPMSKEDAAAFAKAEEDCVCKHCGRCVLAGPPCCYDAIYDLYVAADSEVSWLRKIQSKKDKRINDLEYEIKVLKGLV